ncbi:unnamed protein product [Colias eurytheme]|nr:unnamed protein product [Colias eurytheme]
MPADEGVLWGALGALSRLIWIFGICPVSRSPKVEVSKWKSFYGRYILLTAMMSTFLWSSYDYTKIKNLTVLDVVGYLNELSQILIVIFSIWKAPERIRKWLKCLENMDKKVNIKPEAEKLHYGTITLPPNHLKPTYISRYPFVLPPEPRQLPHISEKIRNLAHSFSSVCEAIESVNDTTGIILLFLIASGVLVIMAGAVIFVNLFVKKESPVTNVIHFLWCVNIISKFIILSEPCHCVYKEMSLMRTHLIMLQKKYIYNERITNELKIFFLLTYLNKKKISPMKIVTIDRLLTVKILQCATAYFVAVIGLKVKTFQL